ncbi:tyrosine-protein phosphatase [Agromyces archimandritae]|uniref:Tyrosine-protein phosphatase n=1 Tax=Agromyces archimandritae TaxID=2781962 RepID=A0A975FKS5_9MICO|nr:tyrosine-protein phosphatase [Agromyces archimandritae]QTX04335.1 tyrosine-protein phosphatase [Agromyces archimandritae]
MDTTTRIPVPGTYNFRDVGGLSARGGEVRPGVLFRSDGLHRLGPAGRAMLGTLGVRSVIDLRDRYEAERMPDDLDGLDVEVRSLPVFEGSGASQNGEDVSLEQLYERMLTRHAPVLANAVRAVAAQPAGSTVVHCTAGKDRTGVVVALSLLSVGVDRATVVEDYARTEAHLAGEWLEEMVQLVGRFGVPDSPGLRMLMGGSPPEALDHALDLVEREHGSANEYLVASGVAPAELRSLETRLLVK